MTTETSPEEQVRLTARLDPDIHEALQRHADDQDRSVNWSLNHLLRYALVTIPETLPFREDPTS